MAQWLRLHLPIQGTRVGSLAWEDPTFHGATKPLSHNYWARVPRARALQQEEPPQWEAHIQQQRVAPHSLQLEKAQVQQQRPNAAKKKETNEGLKSMV